MPELPEVETIVRETRPYLEGRAILDVCVDWARTIAQPAEDVEQFRDGVRGRQIVGLGRRGKFVLLHLSDRSPRGPLGSLCEPRGSPYEPWGSPREPWGSPHKPWGTCLVHLRMSGRLLLKPLGRPQHLRVTFVLSGGGGRTENARLYFYDQRKFGRIWLARDAETVVGDLGPEPLSAAFTPDAFIALLRKRRGMLKPLLLNQRFIAGLGNIYVDESLFRAGLHPRRTADTLTEVEAARLHGAIQSVLQQALDHHGTTFDGVFIRPQGEEGRQQEGLNVYGQAGLPCSRCGTPIERIVVGGRGTHFCPRCQPWT